MTATLVFLAVYAVFVSLVGWLVARLVARRWPAVRMPVLIAATAMTAIACLPVPIHGGFILLGPELARETISEWRRARASAAETRRETRADSRFAGWLPSASVGDAWRDPATGLVWSRPVWRAAEVTPAAMAEAQRRCAALEPAGYWALPRNAEFFWLARTDRASGAWLAEMFLWPEGLSLPTLIPLSRSTAADGAASQSSGRSGAEVRCVAVTPPAPVRGYRSADIPLAEWNAFQVGLTAPAAAR